jgi:AraC-like DNA-binding protein
MSDVVAVEVTERPPLLPGVYFVGREANRSPAAVMETRYRSASRAGRILSVDFDDNLALVVNDGLWGTTSTFEAAYRGDDQCVLSFRLSGNCQESINQNTYSLGAFTCSMIHYAQGVRHVFRLMPGEPLVEVCIVFRASFFKQKYHVVPMGVERLLAPSRRRASDPWFSQCRMTPAMEAVIRDLRAVSPFSNTWLLFAEAKSLELLSLFLEQLDADSAESNCLPQTTQDLRRLHAVREYLRNHYRHPPRIDELCRLAGFNRRKLSEGFKSEFGRTVFEYIQYLRMEQARALFQNGLTDINRVARQVGYAHQSNFAKAFKRCLGMSPRQCLRAQRHPR